MEPPAINGLGLDALLAAREWPHSARRPPVDDRTDVRTDSYEGVGDLSGLGGFARLAAEQTTRTVAAQTIATTATEQTAAPPPGDDLLLDTLLDRLPEDVRNDVVRYLRGEVDAEYYSAENTADRITSFVVDGFEHFEGGAAAQENSTEARQRFVDFIVPAIDEGFKQALNILAPLHDAVVSRVEETRELVGTRLQAFVDQDSVDTVA